MLELKFGQGTHRVGLNDACGCFQLGIFHDFMESAMEENRRTKRALCLPPVDGVPDAQLE